jgi:hypothetical protein
VKGTSGRGEKEFCGPEMLLEDSMSKNLCGFCYSAKNPKDLMYYCKTEPVL